MLYGLYKNFSDIMLRTNASLSVPSTNVAPFRKLCVNEGQFRSPSRSRVIRWFGERQHPRCHSGRRAHFGDPETWCPLLILTIELRTIFCFVDSCAGSRALKRMKNPLRKLHERSKEIPGASFASKGVGLRAEEGEANDTGGFFSDGV